MRLQTRNEYASECQVKCTDNGKVVEAEVDKFIEKESISVILEGVVRVKLNYTKFNEYVGSMGGLEFVTKGPKFLGSVSYR